jgi:hypothetical protein
MELLPDELLPMITADARSWLMMSHTSKTMAARMQTTLVHDDDYVEVETRSYIISFNRYNIILLRGDDRIDRIGSIGRYTNIMMMISQSDGTSCGLYTFKTPDMIFASRIYNIHLTPYVIAPTIIRFGCTGYGTPVDTIIYCLIGDKPGKKILGHHNNHVGDVLITTQRRAIIKFANGILGDGEKFVAIDTLVVRTTMSVHEILAALPQLGGHIYSVEPLF